MSVDLTKFGGQPIIPVGARIADINPGEYGYNFGVKEDTSIRALYDATPSLHEKYPKMAGAWDGKSTINHIDIVLKNFGGDIKKVEELIHYQPRGTCGGRAGAAGLDFVQHIMIGNGKRAKFKRASHAAVYFLARYMYGWTGRGNWRNDGDDGVAGGSVPDALKKYGAAHRDEAQDPNWYGPGSDDVACKLVTGNLPQLEQQIIAAASDNLVTDWVPVRSAQEAADAIASQGIVIGSDMRGFTMSRDKDGFCSPRGTWSHYHLRCSVGLHNGRKGFGYWQSWSKDTPSGPFLKGHTGNCFGVDWDVQDASIRSGQYAAIFGFPLWELETTPVAPWIFG